MSIGGTLCALALHRWGSHWSLDEHGKIAASGRKWPEATHRRCSRCKQTQRMVSERRVDMDGGAYMHSKWITIDIVTAKVIE